ncbi:hypothetical protein P7K49_014613 [Saguinus oedipus]|uniref:PLAT domain-containing protein n=1 Tax=Saguinus oedipus TaxID=9490 RepID=A0ABQ9V837_SAGOE|nr:hypothetical protein P7K49_014613 [Saguinus oedipus]
MGVDDPSPGTAGLSLCCRPQYLGPLLFVKPRKRHLLQDDAWFCSWISIVQGPGVAGDDVRFPCYRWVEGDGILSLTEGTGGRWGAREAGRMQGGEESAGWGCGNLECRGLAAMGTELLEAGKGKPREEELEERRKWYW